MKIIGLVAVRSGSLRVSNKNIRPFCGSNILEVKLNQLKRISQLDEVYVNSNDDDMLKIAKDCGCIGVKRDEYFATNEVPMREVYENIAMNCEGDIIVYANATNPLLEDKTIVKAIELFEKNPEFNSLNSAHQIKEFLFYDNKPQNFTLEKFPRSQDLPDYVALNFAVSIISRENMIKHSHIIGDKPYIYKIDTIEGTDIDDMIDFEFSEFLYKKQVEETLKW